MSQKKLTTLKRRKEGYGYYSEPGEDFRMLRNNIEFSSLDKKIQSITVTSGSPFEGKSTTSANLAVTMANTYKRVLLIDADIRVPDLHKKFNIDNTVGLTDALFALRDGESFELAKYIQKLKHSNIAHELYIITAGRSVPNADLVFHSDEFKKFMDLVKASFDFVVCDTAPVLLVADAIPVSLQTDATLFCVANKMTKIDATKRAYSILQRNHVNVIGSVITMIRDKDLEYYYYYYSKYNYSKTKNYLEKNS
jgi:capsular exopolysaccharide synthesis family protein